MFSDSIDNKINKIKVNFDNYLNDRRTSQPPVPSIRRSDMPSTQNMHPPAMSSSAPTHPSQLGAPPKPVDIEVKQMILQGKTFEKQPICLRNVNKEKIITIQYVEDPLKLKL
jgi:hypothetical protein